MNRVRIAAHAKANLTLRILDREPSGYHNLETLFSLLELHDVLEVERIESGIEFSARGADTGPEHQNLAYRAADLVLDATGRKFGVKIALTKSIPVQAGLGGGSSHGCDGSSRDPSRPSPCAALGRTTAHGAQPGEVHGR